MQEKILKLIARSNGSYDVLCTNNNLNTYVRSATQAEVKMMTSRTYDLMGSDR